MLDYILVIFEGITLIKRAIQTNTGPIGGDKV